jgi:hypothetical protein
MATATKMLGGPALGAAGPSGQPEVAPWLVALARLLDNAFTIPGTNKKFGVDALIGLIPVIGDLFPALTALAFYAEGKRLGVSKWTQWRMLLNSGVDFLVGLIPFVGDVFDVFVKSNAKNLDLLLKEIEKRKKAGTFQGEWRPLDT